MGITGLVFDLVSDRGYRLKRFDKAKLVLDIKKSKLFQIIIKSKKDCEARNVNRIHSGFSVVFNGGKVYDAIHVIL